MSNQKPDFTTPKAMKKYQEMYAMERASFEAIDENEGSFLYEDGFDVYIDRCRNESIRYVWRKVLSLFRKKEFKLGNLLWCFSNALGETFPESDKVCVGLERISFAMDDGTKLVLSEVLETGETKVVWSNFPREGNQ